MARVVLQEGGDEIAEVFFPDGPPHRPLRMRRSRPLPMAHNPLAACPLEGLDGTAVMIESIAGLADQLLGAWVMAGQAARWAWLARSS
ncbi:MAG TPA: hypothetical protein VK162_16125, partial [Streptosporangiaceae bacterium]|nr:hypothetical protein [Streptosporangiaceae bacterium]